MQEEETRIIRDGENGKKRKEDEVKTKEAASSD